MLVGVIPPAGFQGPETKALAHLIVQFADGSTFDFVDVPPGCPLQVMNVACTVPVYTGDSDAFVDLKVESLTGVMAKQHVEIRARNHCGSDVAYVAVTAEADGSLAIIPPRYISPCP